MFFLIQTNFFYSCKSSVLNTIYKIRKFAQILELDDTINDWIRENRIANFNQKNYN